MDIKDYKNYEFNQKRVAEIISSIVIFIVGIIILVISFTREKYGLIALGVVLIIVSVLILLWNIYLLKKNNESDF